MAAHSWRWGRRWKSRPRHHRAASTRAGRYCRQAPNRWRSTSSLWGSSSVVSAIGHLWAEGGGPGPLQAGLLDAQPGQLLPEGRALRRVGRGQAGEALLALPLRVLLEHLRDQVEEQGVHL